VSLLVSLELQRNDFQLSVHCAIESSGITAIYGHSGAGKTTLLRWLAGLEPQTKGHLSFNDQIWQDDKQQLPSQQRNIAYVFQDGRLFPHLTVRDNLEYSFKRRFNDNGPGITQVSEWLVINQLLAKMPAELSAGQQQRVAISRALLSAPQLLLMDEPLASLDNHSKKNILHHLKKLQQKLTLPILYVSHDIEEISQIADHLVLMEQGKISAQGSLQQLFTRLDLNISHEENAGSMINAVVSEHDDIYQLTELKINQQLTLQLTKIDCAIGDTVIVRIPARDVSISLNKAKDSSILNILPAIIDEIETTNAAKLLLRLRIGEQILLVRLTRKSVERLRLAVGMSVYAQIKTVALLTELTKP
jgi:molybdate transport system ATP-binding protein